MIDQEPIFLKNLPDNEHCLQATMLMVLHTLGYQISFDDLDEMIPYKRGCNTSVANGALVLSDLVPGTRFITRYLAEGNQAELLSSGIIDKHQITVKELKELLPQNYFLANVYADRLVGCGNPRSHMVLLYNLGSYPNTFLMHDPGLPANKAQPVDQDFLMWALGIGGILVPKNP